MKKRGRPPKPPGEGESSTSTGVDASAVMVKIETDTGKPQLICHLCQKALHSLSGFIAHLKKHEPPGGFVCNLCPARFCMSDLLKVHKDEEHTVLACRICQATFGSPDEYQHHIQTVHDGIDRIMSVCEKCNANFKTKEALQRHVDTKCGTVKSHICDQCGAAFYTKYNLANHKVLHGEKTFCCSFCGKSFMQKGRLVIHERQHTGEKPYKCDICEKSFAHRESLVTHSTLHTGIKPIACKRCDARFSCHSNLIKHRRGRPDSCGLPEYDYKKGPSGSRTPRINPKLMKSEIRATKSAKIIRPDHVTNVKRETHPRSSKPEPIYNEVSDDSDECNDFFDTNDSHANAVDDDDSKSVKAEKADDTEQAYIDIESLFLVNSAIEPEVKMEEGDQVIELKTERDMLNESDPMSDLKVKDCQLDADEVEEIKRDPIRMKITIPSKNEPKSEHSEQSDSDWSDEVKTPKRKTRQARKPRQVKIKKEPKPPAERKKRKPREPKKEPTEEVPEGPPVKKRRRSRGSILKQIKLLKQMKEKITFECKEPNCVKLYHFKGSYEKHLREIHGKTDDEVLLIVQAVEPDITADFGTKCPICGKMYIREKRLQSHMKHHGPDGSLKHKCPCYCNLHFATKEEASEHSKEAHKAQLFCEICNKFFLQPDALSTHIRCIHKKTKETTTADRNLVCGMCGKRFYSRTYLNDHERSNCGREPIYKCNICGKGYTTAGILKTHSLLHKDDTPFLCQLCGKTFKVQAQYKTHLKVRHTDLKPFQCTLCPKAYPYRESLLTHMTIHTGFKRYLCSGCGSRYSCISNLQAHRKVHANTCGLLPLNSKPSEYMGVQKGVLLSGVKPFA